MTARCLSTVGGSWMTDKLPEKLQQPIVAGGGRAMLLHGIATAKLPWGAEVSNLPTHTQEP